ncbi:MAG: thiamine pyrophosphate-dependent enzyme [Oscillospiraceae bacterium]|nr:thiamine pyrophosphate-dependent enzyme [Oscillospiraceae bacterium]
MPKSLMYSPESVMNEKDIRFEDIPVLRYDRTLEQELAAKAYTPQALLRIYRDMRYIREFENMLMAVRTTKNYNGIEYMYTGPAHLYIGEESAAVGQAYLLGVNDLIFGSHRSHGEVIAKGLSAINKLADGELMEIMQSSFDGRILAIVKKDWDGQSVKELAIRFLLYGLMAELFGRETGFSKGLGNSMHFFFLPFGIYPNNAIVGGSAPVAAGAGLFKKLRKQEGVCIANIGDGSLGCGPVFEALNFASMDQYSTLWEDGYKGGLPVIFNIMDNGYGMGGQTRGETMAYRQAARVAAGVSPTQLHAERVNGEDPLAVIEAYSRKLRLIRDGEGPVFLDVLTYRFCGHAPSDQDAYRTREEIESWQKIDCITTFAGKLTAAGVATEADFAAIDAQIKENITAAFRLATDLELSPRMDLRRDPDAVARYIFSNRRVPAMLPGEPEVNGAREDNSRWKKIQKKARYAYGADGKLLSQSAVYSYRDAIFEPIFDKMYEDASLIAYGEDVRDWGGAFGVYQGMSESIPYHRLFNSPISESAIVSSAVGYGMCGGRSVIELMYCDFMGRAGDEIFNQLAKWQAMSAGQLLMPVVLRVSVGALYGAQHSQDWTSLAAHVPGLKIVFPATPYDAKGLMTAALNGTDPVLFFESQRLYSIGEQLHEPGVPAESYEIAIGEPDIKRAGSDVTVLSVGAALYAALGAAKTLAEKYGVSAEVIDARSLVPFDYGKVVASVKKTGKIVLVSDACSRGSYLNDLARNISELCFNYLDAPPVLVGAQNWITPCAELEKEFFPQPEWIIDAIDQKIMRLGVDEPAHNFTAVEQLLRESRGV